MPLDHIHWSGNKTHSKTPHRRKTKPPGSYCWARVLARYKRSYFPPPPPIGFLADLHIRPPPWVKPQSSDFPAYHGAGHDPRDQVSTLDSKQVSRLIYLLRLLLN